MSKKFLQFRHHYNCRADRESEATVSSNKKDENRFSYLEISLTLEMKDDFNSTFLCYDFCLHSFKSAEHRTQHSVHQLLIRARPSKS